MLLDVVYDEHNFALNNLKIALLSFQKSMRTWTKLKYRTGVLLTVVFVDFDFVYVYPFSFILTFFLNFFFAFIFISFSHILREASSMSLSILSYEHTHMLLKRFMFLMCDWYHQHTLLLFTRQPKWKCEEKKLNET